MKKTIEEARTMIKDNFGENSEFPIVTIGEAMAYGEEYRISYAEQGKKLYVYDVSTVWEIDMISGDIFHCGKGNGCFWAYYGCLKEEEEE